MRGAGRAGRAGGLEHGDVRGDLSELSVNELLVQLTARGRTGTLSIRTGSGAGEVRLVGGEVIDAVYRSVEGEKALFRLLSEEEGEFAFSAASLSPLRRIQIATAELLREGARHALESRRLRAALSGGDDALILGSAALASPGAPSSAEAPLRIAEALTVPRTLDELLDAIPLPDLEILEALAPLLDSGAVRRISQGALPIELADQEQLVLLARAVRERAHGGYRGAARLLLVGSQPRLATVSHALRRIQQVTAVSEGLPASPVPHLLAMLRLAESAELEIVALPAVDAYAPLWALSVPGSVVAVRIDSGDAQAPGAIEELCSVTAVPLLEARNLIPELDDADPQHAAALLRSALEAIARL